MRMPHNQRERFKGRDFPSALRESIFLLAPPFECWLCFRRDNDGTFISLLY